MKIYFEKKLDELILDIKLYGRDYFSYMISDDKTREQCARDMNQTERIIRQRMKELRNMYVELEADHEKLKTRLE